MIFLVISWAFDLTLSNLIKNTIFFVFLRPSMSFDFLRVAETGSGNNLKLALLEWHLLYECAER